MFFIKEDCPLVIGHDWLVTLNILNYLNVNTLSKLSNQNII